MATGWTSASGAEFVNRSLADHAHGSSGTLAAVYRDERATEQEWRQARGLQA
jgi:hypothetical protein